ncbi:beta-1,6-N-acetylglucosaminyltransferase [Caulobacter sp. UNC279MFTsu5.1]|uniref:beta-1,6-N-acetylglucosaminyltransferase n=1 Tax=Caulobacter sp. UNC279MFTsu5.1 TaxID=1502775 RepID=UPI0008F3C587|nr:beta-1,6-N-acetylglucosaminyltransferase [Caulobacter sp. UNC279MFTsu5.1]SFJ35296.1 Core-2/I-Branching enzyme [Caulobacter sp. UNC279MFTsu5.1]
MIAYLVLVHRFPEQFKRLFKAIHDPANHYLIHVDKNSGPELEADIRGFLAAYPNADVLESKTALWGGYSLVDAELRGMARLLEMGRDWEVFINLSGQDFPLKTQKFIKTFLARRRGQEFIKASDQQQVRPDTMPRVRKYVFELRDRIVRTILSRRFLPGAKPYIGNQWMMVSRRFCEFVCHDRRADRYKAFYRNTFIADEGFFQTVMMNTAEHGVVVQDDMRMIDWIPDGDIKLRPRTYGMQDAAALIASPDLFARKFDAGVDAGILDILESHLAAQDIANPEIGPAPRREVEPVLAAV